MTGLEYGSVHAHNERCPILVSVCSVLSHRNLKPLFCGSLTLTKLNKVLIRYYRICVRETWSYCRKCSTVHLVIHPKIYKWGKCPCTEVWPVFIHQFRYLHYFAFFPILSLIFLLSNEPWGHAEAFGLLKALRSSPPSLYRHIFMRGIGKQYSGIGNSVSGQIETD